MNKREALQAMLDGVKLRLNFWGNTSYVFMDANGDILDNNNEKVSLNYIGSNSWEIYEGPKKKVKYYRPDILKDSSDNILKNINNVFEQDKYIFGSESIYKGYKIITWEEIEVDE